MENDKLNPQPEEKDWFADLMEDPDLNPDVTAEAPVPTETPTAEQVPAAVTEELPAEQSAEPEAAPAAEEIPEEQITEPAEDSTDRLEELLTVPEIEAEIGADEQAVAGLPDISEMELEKIIQEAIAENWEKDDPYGDTATHNFPITDPDFTDMLAVLEGESEESESFPEETEDAEETEETDAEILQNEPEEEDGPVRKVRPRRKKGYGLFGLPHLLSTAIWAAIILAIGISFGRLVWICAADILAFGREDKTITITITETDDLDSIATKLYNAGLIKYPSLFKAYAKLANVMEEGKISVGTFELNTLYDYNALVKGMSTNSTYRETVDVFIPEGYTCKQIFDLLEEKGVCSVEDMETYAAENTFDSYWFLEDVEKGTAYCLEGFLFPDTYEFYTNSSAKQVYIKLLGRFEDQFDEELKGYLDALNEKTKLNLTLQDVITVASMIQKESAHTGENYNVSSVIYNRLRNPAEYPLLQIDATLVYILGGKSTITDEDKKIDSPYNTYMYGGLPPTPISNPGISAIYAALSPAETKYYYYALDPKANEHHFSETYKEHLKFLESLKK